MNIKKIVCSLFFLGLLTIAPIASAQGMMDGYFNNSYYNNAQNVYASPEEQIQTAQDEEKGKAIWDQLQAKKVTCIDLKDDDYDVLGDYFMGLMLSNNHAAMNSRMSQMMGDEGEKQMHIVLGKRYSRCDTSAILPNQYQGFSYMMPMMGGVNFNGYSMMNGYNQQSAPWSGGMMGINYGLGGFSIFGWGTMVLLWALLILGIIALIKIIKRK